MQRRSFFKKAAATALLPWALDGLYARAYGRADSKFLTALTTTTDYNDRVLVVIQLNGGNDGLNTVVPLDQLGKYQQLRANIALPEDKVLRLHKQPQAGLHPAMSGFQNLFNDGRLAIVQNVGYTNPNFSHFQANDIWAKGAIDHNSVDTGWLGRYLDAQLSQQQTTMRDPLAIQISAVPSTALVSPELPVTLAIQNVDSFARLIGQKPGVVANATIPGIAGEYLSFVREQQAVSVGYADQLRQASEKGKNGAEYPSGNKLGDQLKLVARLIHGGLRTKVYYVTLGSFDTHARQVNTTDSTTGTHANLLKQLSDAVSSFLTDLKLLKIDHRVAGMTFSEFGRRAASNGGQGTDHGWASPQFVFGNGIKNAWIGSTPELSNLDKNNIRIQFDFRQLYASLLTDWFGASESDVRTALLGEDYAILPIFRERRSSLDSTMERGALVYPNPASTEAIVQWPFGEKLRELQVLDTTGRPVTIAQRVLSEEQMLLELHRVPAGMYLVRVQTTESLVTHKLVVQ